MMSNCVSGSSLTFCNRKRKNSRQTNEQLLKKKEHGLHPAPARVLYRLHFSYNPFTTTDTNYIIYIGLGRVDIVVIATEL